MDGMFKTILTLGAGAGLLYAYQKLEEKKNKPNPEDEIEAHLENRIREMDYRDRLMAAKLS